MAWSSFDPIRALPPSQPDHGPRPSLRGSDHRVEEPGGRSNPCRRRALRHDRGQRRNRVVSLACAASLAADDYACAETEARLVGVSTVVGNVSLANATRNTRAALIGRADVPASPGAAFPLAPEPNDARAVHCVTGLGHAMLPEPPEPAVSAHAVDAIVAAAAAAHAGRLVLVATGPLTNIALAVMREAGAAGQIQFPASREFSKAAFLDRAENRIHNSRLPDYIQVVV